MPAALRHALTLTAAALLSALPVLDAHAWSLSIASASRRVFLHVGDGTLNSNNGTVNRVEVNDHLVRTRLARELVGVIG